MSELEKLRKENEKLKREFEALSSLIQPKWIEALAETSEADRKEAIKIIKHGIRTFKQGEESEEGEELLQMIENDCEIIGFANCASYVRAKGTDLEKIFIHPFGQRTLLLKLKKYPVLLMVNSSINFNKSALKSIDGNQKYCNMFNVIGITN